MSTLTERTRQRSATLRVMRSSRGLSQTQVVSTRWSTRWVMEVGTGCTGSTWKIWSWRYPTWALLAPNPAMWWTSTMIMTTIAPIIHGSQQTHTYLTQTEWTLDTSLISDAQKAQCTVLRRAATDRNSYSCSWHKQWENGKKKSGAEHYCTWNVFSRSYVLLSGQPCWSMLILVDPCIFARRSCQYRCQSCSC